MGVDMREKERKSTLNVVTSSLIPWTTGIQSHQGPLRDNVELAHGVRKLG